MTQPRDERTQPVEGAQELNAQELEQVSGGLPAVQKVREAAARLRASQEPLEQSSLSFVKT